MYGRLESSGSSADSSFFHNKGSVIRLDEKFCTVDVRFHSLQKRCIDLLTALLDHTANDEKNHECLHVIAAVVEQFLDRFESKKSGMALE